MRGWRRGKVPDGWCLAFLGVGGGAWRRGDKTLRFVLYVSPRHAVRGGLGWQWDATGVGGGVGRGDGGLGGPTSGRVVPLEEEKSSRLSGFVFTPLASKRTRPASPSRPRHSPRVTSPASYGREVSTIENTKRLSTSLSSCVRPRRVGCRRAVLAVRSGTVQSTCQPRLRHWHKEKRGEEHCVSLAGSRLK